MTTTVALSDGGYLEVTTGSGGTESLQKYDSGGNPVGSAYTAPSSAQIVALTGGGYVVAFVFSYQVTDVENVFFSASAQATNTVYELGSSFTLAASPEGGVVEATRPSAGYGGQPPSDIVFLDTSGHSLIPTLQVWSSAAPVVSVAGDGTYQVNWSDNVGPLSVTLDPSNPVAPSPPLTPSVSLIDDVGPVTGTFGSGVSTDDAHPTLRVAVTETGRIYLTAAFGLAPTGFAVTDADVAQGYVDIPYSGGQGGQTLKVSETGPDGVLGDSTSFTFNIDQVPALAPILLRALDNVGAVQNVVSSGGSTDDAAPTVEVRFTPGTLLDQSVGVGDQVQLLVDGAAVGSPVTVGAADLVKGYVDITMPTLADGTHSLTALVTDAAGNVSPASAPFALTVQPDSGAPPPPAPAGALPQGHATINLTDGGFLESWTNASSQTGLPVGSFVQKLHGSGDAVGALASAGTDNAFVNLLALSNGGYVAAAQLPTGDGVPSGLDLQVFDAAGSKIADDLGALVTGSQISSSAGGFMVDWRPYTPYYQGLPEADFSLYDNAGNAIYSDLRLYYTGAFPTLSVASNGDYLLSWQVGSTAHSIDIDPNRPQDLSPPPAPSISEYLNGGYVPPGQTVQGTPTLRFSVTETGTIFFGLGGVNNGETTGQLTVSAADVARGYVEMQAPTFGAASTVTINARAANAEGVVGSDVNHYTYSVAPVGPSGIIPYGGGVSLPASAGWTSAAVLSNHALAVVAAQDGGYGSHVGAEQTYDASGNETASAPLMGYAAAGEILTPEVTALAYGYYQVNYAGSSDYEVYNASDERVFVQNVYTSQTAAVTPLAGGGYVEADPNSSVFAVFDANNNALDWDSYAPGSTGNPTVHALADGAFVFTYAGSREIESYGATGHLIAATNWGAPVQNYAMGLASLGQNGFLGAWIGTDITPGPSAGQTAILIEPFFNDGSTITRTLTLAQDLDPWHTTFKLQAHADGSVAILWSQGGGVFGAEFGGGGASDVHPAVAGDLASMVLAELPQDQEGMAWLQDGQVWAEIFDPATGAVQRAELGVTDSPDLSTVHLVATASGGLAASWHSGGGVEAAVLDSAGHVSAVASLPGDFLGVDALGHAVTLHDVNGTPTLQAYTLGDGLFWAA